MTIRLVPVQNFNNPNLPIADFVSPLARQEAIAIYEMYGPQDISGNGKHLSVVGHTFSPQGMVCSSVEGNFAETGLVEPESFTVVVAHYLTSLTGATTSIISSLSEIISPFSGHRLAINSGGGQSLAIGQNPLPSFSIPGGTAAGGWTAYAYTVSGKTGVLQRSNGQTYTGTIDDAHTRSLAKTTIKIAGNLKTTPGLDLPPNGTIGCIGIYQGDLGVDGRAALIISAKQVMARKGTIVP